MQMESLCPRLKFWISSAVTLMSNLDMYPVFPPQFGRLPTRKQLSQISNNLQLAIFEAIRLVLSSYTSKYIQIIEQDNQHGSSVNSDACPYSS